jgi:hypothetical protein
MKGRAIRRIAKFTLYGVLSCILLFMGFFANYWQVADQQWFLSQNYDMESFVVGRIVKSHQDGIFSDGGLTGNGSPDATRATFENEAFVFQYRAYENGLRFGSFSTYDSQIGGQGIVFSIVDELIRLSPRAKLRVFHALTSLLTSVTITLIALWFYEEFGLLVSLPVLASSVLSPWLTVFGGKLWWSMWSFYLPMVVMMFHLKNRSPASSRHIMLGVLAFMGIFVKCLLTGYEYITTTLIMMMVPFVYYSTLQRLNFREFIRGSLTAVFSSSLAILLSLTILCAQIASVQGSFSKGVDHIAYSLKKRTYAAPDSFQREYAASLDPQSATVVMTYLGGSFFGPSHYLPTSSPFISRVVRGVKYLYLIFLFGIISVFLFALRGRYLDREKEKSSLALVSATWFSLLAPLSWFVIFKSHSFAHTHMNYIVWQMPFTLFGFAICGLLLQTVLTRVGTALAQFFTDSRCRHIREHPTCGSAPSREWLGSSSEHGRFTSCGGTARI